jgi:hypothetical protein
MRWRAARRAGVRLVLATGLYAWFVWLNLVPGTFFRFVAEGMLSPVGSFTEACKELRANRHRMSVSYEGVVEEWLGGVGHIQEIGRSCRVPPGHPRNRRRCHIHLALRLPDVPRAASRMMPQGCPRLGALRRFAADAGVELR